MKSFDKPRTNFTVDTKGLLVRISQLDGAVQIYIPSVYRLAILHLCHYATLVGHPGERLVYDTISIHCYWPYIVKDVYGAGRCCESCARNWQTRNNNENYGSFRQYNHLSLRLGRIRPCSYVCVKCTSSQSSKTHPFTLIITREPPEPATMCPPTKMGTI